MESKKKLCKGCDKEQFIWKSHGRYKYCKSCWLRVKPKKPLVQIPLKSKRSAIRKKSSKMSALDTVYFKLRKNFLYRYPLCGAALPKCTSQSTDVHHMKGRGKYYNNVTTWLSVCRTCHDWIETHPIEAEELGLSIKRN